MAKGEMVKDDVDQLAKIDIHLYDRIREIAISFDESGNSFQSKLTLLLDSESGNGKSQLYFSFSGVNSLRFLKDLSSYPDISPILIKNISSHQLENIHYSVIDFEEEVLSFNCQSFTCQILTT